MFSQNDLGLRLGTIGSTNNTLQSITAISSSVKTDSGILIQAGKSGPDEGHGVIISGSSESRTFRIKSHATDNIMFADGDGLVMFNSGTNSSSSSPDEQNYPDINFFVSGSQGSKGSSTKGTALFGGDLHVSGNLTVDGTGAGGSPGGSNTELQFNNGGSFGGISGATTDGSAVTFGDSAILVGQDITHDGDSDTKITLGS